MLLYQAGRPTYRSGNREEDFNLQWPARWDRALTDIGCASTDGGQVVVLLRHDKTGELFGAHIHDTTPRLFRVFKEK